MDDGCRSGLDWCGGGHLCRAELAEHRSQPWTIRTRYGAMVATRVRHRGRDRLELRTLIDLPADHAGRTLAERLMLGVDLAVRRAVGLLRAGG